MASTQREKQRKKLQSESEPIKEDNENPSPSIYGVVAAHSLSRDIKQKSLHLIKVKRRHGDWGQFDMSHAWSPEDLSSNMGSRHGSGLARESSLADDNLTMARPFVMEPPRTFQVCLNFTHLFKFSYTKPPTPIPENKRQAIKLKKTSSPSKKKLSNKAFKHNKQPKTYFRYFTMMK